MNDPDNYADDNAADYDREAVIERFRRDNPTWTESEVLAYLSQHE